MKNTLILFFSVFVGLVLFEGVAHLLPEDLFSYKNKYFKGDIIYGMAPQNPDLIKKDFPEDMKPNSVYRIVVLGDSHTQSVKNDISYPEILERLLNSDDLKGKRVEVHNGGTIGWSHYQYYLYLKNVLKNYHPDLVIVGFFIGNDFLDLFRNDDKSRLYFNGQQFVNIVPQFFKAYDPKNADPTFRTFALIKIAFRSTIGYWLDRTRVLWNLGQEGGEGSFPAAKFLYTIIRGNFIDQHIWRQEMNQILYLETFPKERSVIDKVNRKITELMKDLAVANNFKLLYVPSPTKIQIEPDSISAMLDKILSLCNLDRSVFNMEDELTESFVSLLNEYNIESFRVEDTFREEAKKRMLFDPTYHLNKEGHELMGKALYSKVKPMLSSPPFQ